MDIHVLALPPDHAQAVSAVLLTSANAAGALTPALASLPVFAVGAATAAAARAAGADRVVEGEGDGVALAELVAARLGRAEGEMLHLAGEIVDPELGRALLASGYLYRRVTAYRAQARTVLGAATGQALQQGQLDACLFFSRRSAALWCSLLECEGLAAHLAGIEACCLAAAVAEPLRELPFARFAIAAKPTQAALLACLASPVR